MTSTKPQQGPDPPISRQAVGEKIKALETVLELVAKGELTGPRGIERRLRGAILALKALDVSAMGQVVSWQLGQSYPVRYRTRGQTAPVMVSGTGRQAGDLEDVSCCARTRFAAGYLRRYS